MIKGKCMDMQKINPFYSSCSKIIYLFKYIKKHIKMLGES